MVEQKIKVLFIDDEEDLLRTITIVLSRSYCIHTFKSAIEALQKFEEIDPDIVVCDISMPEMNGMDVLKRIKKMNPSVEVIMLTALNDTQLAIQSAKDGAYDYLIKPFDSENIKLAINRAFEKKQLLIFNKTLKRKLNAFDDVSFENIIGNSEPMNRVFDLIQKVSKNNSTVLIEGETGTGKELIARAIHNLSSRKNMPFIAVNCGAIPADLFESEFFGYEKGAFTGANSSKEGKFEVANGGTLFLDEISSLPLGMQIKLLRATQEQEIVRVGGHYSTKVDVRIISASNESLKRKIDDGSFRKDFYHRISVVPIKLPPLRLRGKDILLLAEFFLNKYTSKYNKNFSSFSDDASKVFCEYMWPGNVRELEHVIEKIVSIEDGSVVDSVMVPLEMYLSKSSSGVRENNRYKQIMNEFEKNLLEAALSKNSNNQSKTAKYLGISRTTLISKMESLGLK